MRLDNIYKSLNVIKFYCSQTNLKIKEEFVTRVLEARWSSLGCSVSGGVSSDFRKQREIRVRKGFLKSTSAHQKSFRVSSEKRRVEEDLFFL